jgi:DHA2 family multidrug resistance protein
MTATPAEDKEEEEDEESGLPPRQRILVALAILPAGSMQGMDTFATGVAIPRMMGSFSVTLVEISWVLTSYLVASAMFTPFYAWLSRKVGCKNLFIAVTAGFVCTSIMSAQSNTLMELVVFRFFQGAFGAGFNPLTIQIILAAFPRSRHGIAFGWLQMGRNSSIVIGPIVGGILTELYDWRIIYLVNVPVGLIGLFLILRVLPKDKKQVAKPFDFFGFVVLSVELCAAQLLLSQGGKLDWFNARIIVVYAFFAAAFSYVFIFHAMTARQPYLNLRVFKNREFLIGMILVVFAQFMIYGYIGLLPPILQNQLGLPVIEAGIIIAYRGIGSMCASFLAGFLVLRYSPKYLIFFGMLGIAFSTYSLSKLSPDVHTLPIIIAIFLQGFGLGFVKTPILAITFSTLSSSLRPDGTSILSTAQRIASGIGISVLIAMLIRSTQSARSTLSQNVSEYNERLQHLVMPDKWALDSVPGVMTLSRMIDKQAEFMAYIIDFQIMTMVTLAMLPLLFFIRLNRDQAKS